MNFLRFAIVILLSTLSAWAKRIDVPLTIQETAGVGRDHYLITSGVPLPQGALKSTEGLQIMNAQGRFIPAQFWVANRWWQDGSVQWVQFDFPASVSANGKATYFLREVGQMPPFPSPIGFIPRGKDMEVITGPLRFVIGGRSNQLLDQVWVDENWGYDFSQRTKILESGNFDLVLTSNNQVYRTSNWSQNKIEVEETNALRAVIKVSGSFAWEDQKEKSLDYICRMTVYGGKTYIKLALTVINRRGDSSEDSVRLDDLSVHVKLNLAKDQQKFAFGGAQEDHLGNFTESPVASLYQETSDRYVLSGALRGTGPGKSTQSLNLGWADLSDDRHGLSIGMKWFWQLYPKAYEVSSDATITAKLFPKEARPQHIHAGVAKAHELLFYFHGKRDFASGQVKNTLIGFQRPVYAVAPPQWYCRETQALGRLPESSEAAYKREYWPLVQKYDEWLVRSRDAVVARRDKVYRFADQETDEYGMLRFGRAADLADEPEKSVDPGSLQETIDYDFPQALYLHFFRTGDLKSLEVAEEGVAYLRDVHTYHSRNRNMLGGNRSGRGLNETGPNSKAVLENKHELAVYRKESLFNSFLLTGNRGALEAGKLSLEHALSYNRLDIAHNTRSIGHVLLGLLKGYQVFGDKRFLDRADWIVNTVHAWQDGNLEALRQLNPPLSETWSEKFRDGYGTESWMYGIAWEALKQHYELTGRKDIPNYMQRSAEWIYRRPEEWSADKKQYVRRQDLAILLSTGLAAIHEYTGDPKYWALAIEAFKAQAGPAATMDRPNLFAQCFCSSQRFLWYLSKDFQATPKRQVTFGIDCGFRNLGCELKGLIRLLTDQQG